MTLTQDNRTSIIVRMDNYGKKPGRKTRRKIYDYILEFKIEHGGISPSIEDISNELGISKSHTHYHLKIMRDNADVTWLVDDKDRMAQRSLRFFGDSYVPPKKQ